MKKLILLAISFLPLLAFAQAGRTDYNIMEFGATLDTLQTNTDAINKAVEACYQNGGGRVIIPAGKFVSGTIVLKSNVELHLANGAELLGSKDCADYPIQPENSYKSLKASNGWTSLIFASDAKNIAISGNGTIDGRGARRKGCISGFGGDRNGRPRNILFISCKNVSVSGITMLNSPIWNQHYLDCEDVIVDRIRVSNHGNGNNDGIDIDGCRRFTLSNSIIDSDDDAIVLKSTGTAPCEDIVINNCVLSSFANAIKCGTETTGGYKNIVVSNCVVKPSNHKGERVLKSTPSGITAISLEIVDGGVMDGVSISNILIEGTECPIFVRLGNRARKHLESAPEPPIGQMRNISISNITAYGVGNFGSSITGIADQKIENIRLSNINIINRGGLKKGNFTLEDTSGKRHDVGKDLQLDRYLPSFREIVEDDKGYPQPTVWANLPVYGLFLRHVENAVVENVTFSSDKPDPRSAILAVNVDFLRLANIDLKSNTEPDVVLHKVAKSAIDKGLKVKKEK